MIGFQKDKNKLSEKQPRDSIFVRIAIDRLRPCTTAELLVFHHTQTKGSTPLATEAQTQRGFIEEHIPLAEPPRTVDDDRDDEMPEPTQTMNAEKRKVDDTAKALRAPLPTATSSHASSSRLDDETHEQLTCSTKQVRITRTRAEAPLDVSFLFLQARMADMRGGNEERMWMMKGNFTLHFCPPEMRIVPRETRRVVWETQMSFNAVDILTDKETRQLTDAGRETYAMQRVGRIGYGDFDTTEGLHEDLRAGNVDSHSIFCSWYTQAPVSTHSCDFTNGYSQGRNRSNLAVSYSERRVTSGAILVSRLPHLRYNGCKG